MIPKRDAVAGVVIESLVVGGAIPKEYIPACKKGVEEALLNGNINQSPVNRRHGQYSRRYLP